MEIPLIDANLGDPAFKANPYPFYARLRTEAPIARVKLPDKQIACLVTRYDDVLAVLKDERFAKDQRKALTPEQLAQWRKSAEPLQAEWAVGVRKAGYDPTALLDDLKASIARYNAAY